jgi:hypothetical protein
MNDKPAPGSRKISTFVYYKCNEKHQNLKYHMEHYDHMAVMGYHKKKEKLVI